MKIYATKHNDGGISLTTINMADYPVGSSYDRHGESPFVVVPETTEQDVYLYIRGELDKCHPGKYGEFREVINIPTDRTFREAWCDETPDNIVDLDMLKVKDIALRKLRAARDIRLSELDKETIIALGASDEARRIMVESEKQLLRDATEPLKDLIVERYNDYSNIEKIKELSVLK